MNQINHSAKDMEIAFFGRMSAGISHELMNVLAIIRERSGLIEDLMALDKEVEFPYRDKLSTALTSIRAQVQRGMEIGEKLNRLSHSMDESGATLDIGDLISRTVFLMQRFARLEKIKITAMPVEPPLTVETDPFRILLVLSACIEYCMARTDEEGEIILEAAPAREGASIRCFTGRGLLPAKEVETIEDLRGRMREPVERLGARIDLFSADDRVGLELILT